MGLVLVGCASCAMPRLRALTRALEQHAAPERPGGSGSVAMPFGDEGAPTAPGPGAVHAEAGQRSQRHGIEVWRCCPFCVSLPPPCANRLARPLTGRHDAAIADRNPTAPAKLAGAPARRCGRHCRT